MNKSLTAVYLLLSAAAIAGPKRNLGLAEFYRPPQISVMVGFIKDPQHASFTVPEWKKGIGEKFDARTLVARVKRSGAATLIWYDKWIDGLVLRKTSSTQYQAERDFLAELAPECHKAGLRLVIYFNTFYDGNPEFEKWACRDYRGKVISYPPPWPAALLSVHSPYRQKVLQQIEELIRNYGIDGLWLDSVQVPIFSSDEWSQAAFQKKYGKPPAAATVDELREFAADSTIAWNLEAAAFARRLKPSCVLTFNGLVDPLVIGPRLAAGLGESADYFSTEMPAFERQLRYAHLLGTYEKPYEGLSMLSDTWFTPMGGEAPITTKSSGELRAEMAAVLSGGANYYMSLTLGHDGRMEEGAGLLLDQAGDWLRSRRAWIEDTEPVHDVGIVLGTSDARSLDWPGGGEYSPVLLKIEDHLRQSGYLPRRLINSPYSQSWSAIPPGMRSLIIPDRACLSKEDAALVTRFVEGGGRVLAFGRGLALNRPTSQTHVAALFGADAGGMLAPPWWRGMMGEWATAKARLTEPIVRLTPRGAEALAWATTASEGSLPLFTRVRAGAGQAYGVAAAESAVADQPEVLSLLWKEALGDTVIHIADLNGRDLAARYTVRLRTGNGRRTLHIIDNLVASESRRPGQRYTPVYLDVRVNTAACRFEKATVVPENRNIPVTTEGAWKKLRLLPSPELLLALE